MQLRVWIACFKWYEDLTVHQVSNIVLGLVINVSHSQHTVICQLIAGSPPTAHSLVVGESKCLAEIEPEYYFLLTRLLIFNII